MDRVIEAQSWPDPLRASTAGSATRRAELRMLARERRREAVLLTAALVGNRLQLTSAARIGLADGRQVATEIGLHWPRGPLSAAAALAASGGGTRRQIGCWMLKTACARATAAKDLVSVPVPPAMLSDDLPHIVAAILNETGLEPARLELLVSETTLRDPSTGLLLCLSAVRDRGIGLALNDFGMRHGSTTLLRHLPLTAIHLDPSLTHDLSPGSEDAAILAALVSIAHRLGLRVAACAVEGPGRVEALRHWGVDEATGRHRLADAPARVSPELAAVQPHSAPACSHPLP